MSFEIEILNAQIEVRVNHAIGRHLLYYRRFPAQIELPVVLYDELLRMRIPNFLEFTPDGRVLYNGVPIVKSAEAAVPVLVTMAGQRHSF